MGLHVRVSYTYIIIKGGRAIMFSKFSNDYGVFITPKFEIIVIQLFLCLFSK